MKYDLIVGTSDNTVSEDWIAVGHIIVCHKCVEYVQPLRRKNKFLDHTKYIEPRYVHVIDTSYMERWLEQIVYEGASKWEFEVVMEISLIISQCQ